MNKQESSQWQPIQNAHQTTEVFVEEGRLKMQIKREPVMAEELI